jgi:Ser/Thr protein kinase RdoA (MazF antagonist)
VVIAQTRRPKGQGGSKMEQLVKARFNDEVARAGAAQFGVHFNELTFLGAWQNFIYEYEQNGKSHILRFTPSTHRTENAVRGELDWIRYLADHEVSVSVPIPSKHNKWTEVVRLDDLDFTVTAFLKAQGRKVGYPECLTNTSLYQSLGQTMGRMHALAKEYRPDNEATRRHHWHDNYYLRNLRNFVPSDQTLVYDAASKLINTIKTTLPQDTSSYGLIHGDIGIGNYLLDEGRGGITLFDFDEAQYSWFIEDIAIPLYYLVYVYGGEEGKSDREAQALLFMEHFMKGYVQENVIDETWVNKLPLFLRLREIIVYTGMHRSADLANLDDWSRDYLAESKGRIERGIPIVDVWNQ